jgi:TIR domain-containing protein
VSAHDHERPAGRKARHVFLSYAREDSSQVDALQRELEKAGLPVWRDTSRLWPGEDWRERIRHAIQEDALVFLACFSRRSVARDRGYHNAELVLAAEELRNRRPYVPWLIPVRFDDCDIPGIDIGLGRSLESLHRADLFGADAKTQRERLVELVVGLLEADRGGPATGPVRRFPPTTALVAAALVGGLAMATLLAGAAPAVLRPHLPRPGCLPAPGSTPVASQSPAASRRATLAVAASFPAPDSEPNALAFDGRDFWVSDNSGTIFRVTQGGQPVASYQAPDVSPEGLTFDGCTFWLFTTNHGLIYHFGIKNGRVRTLGSVNPHAQVFGGGITHNLAWAGRGLWWADQYTVELLTARGAVLHKITKGRDVTGLAWDGRHLWLAYDNFPAGSRIEEDTSAGVSLRAFTVPITSLTALTWADSTLWALGENKLGSQVLVYRLALPAASRG